MPSGVAALLGATTPLWLALIDWRWGTGHVPGWYGRAGLAVGFAGVALLVAPEWGTSHAGIAVASIAVVGASLAWAAGSVYGRGAALPRDVRLSTAVQLLAGAVWLAAASLATGEWRGFSPARVTPASAAALLYLIVFGSVIAFTAYVWLMRTTTASRGRDARLRQPDRRGGARRRARRRALHPHDDRRRRSRLSAA